MRNRDERGAIAIIVALMAVFLFALAALVVDLGLARDTRRESQNAADAAALAAVNVLYPSTGKCSDGTSTPPDGCKADAAAAAKAYVEANLKIAASDWNNCASPPTGYARVIGYPECISIDAPGQHVWVLLPGKNVPFGFGVTTGKSAVRVSAAARAVLSPDTSVTCALCFMHELDTKKFKVDVGTAGVFVNGAIDLHPGGVTWTASVVTAATAGGISGIPTPPIQKIIQPSPANHDPYATRTDIPPSTTGMIIKDAGTNPCTAFDPTKPTKSGGPGVYGEFEFGANCTLTPGLYVLTEAWTAKNKTLTFNNVTLYATCGTRTSPQVCSGDSASGGSFDSKNASLTITSPVVSYMNSVVGMAIIYDRDNHAPVGMQGNGATTVTGAIYAPSANWDFNGTSDVIVSGGPVILGSMTGNGGTGIQVTGANSVVVPGLLTDPALDQ